MNRIKKVKRQNRYPNDLKRKVTLEYLSGRFSYAVAVEGYGLTGKEVAKEFVKWYRQNYEIGHQNKAVIMSKSKSTSSPSKNQELYKRIKEHE